MSTLGERIKYIRNNILKANQTAFAKSLGFSRLATISDYEKDKRSPDINTLRKIAGIGGVKLEWLLTGDGPISIYEASGSFEMGEAVTSIYSEGFAEANVYDMHAVAGPKNFPGAEPISSIMVPALDFRRGPVAIRVKGDGMRPSILDGAIAGIDVKDRGLISGGLYAVWLNYEGATIKRLFVYPDRIVLRPDNPAFPETAIFNAELGEDFIIGKVVWVYQRY